MYRRPRIIPTLLMDNQNLVKTINFKKPRYIGDPINTVKIFNNKYVDELCLLDITATKDKRELDFDFLKEIASEAFMPLSYGGGIKSLEEIKKLFHIGYEKVILNTAFYKNRQLVKDAVSYAGSQSIVASIDAKKDLFGKIRCYIGDGRIKVKESPFELAQIAESIGVGEILLNSIDEDGKMKGYDTQLVKNVVDSVNIPVIACGGAGKLEDMKEVLDVAGAHAAAAGSFFIYYGVKKAVLITAPKEEELFELGIYEE